MIYTICKVVVVVLPDPFRGWGRSKVWIRGQKWEK